MARVLDIGMEGRVMKRVTPGDEPADTGQPERPHRIPHTDEVRHGVVTRMARAIARGPRGAKVLRAVGAAVGLVDPAKRPPRESPAGPPVDAWIVAASAPGRYTAQREHAAEAAHGVGTTAEAEEIDAIAGLVHPDQGVVAVGDVPGNPEAGCLADQVVDLAPAAPARTVGRRAEAWVVKRLLDAGDDGAGMVQLVDIARNQPGASTRLPGPVGEDHDVLGQPATSTEIGVATLQSSDQAVNSKLTQPRWGSTAAAKSCVPSGRGASAKFTVSRWAPCAMIWRNASVTRSGVPASLISVIGRMLGAVFRRSTSRWVSAIRMPTRTTWRIVS